jgi:hypothetical protein
MTPVELDRLEIALRTTARGFEYPPAPDISAAVRSVLGRPRVRALPRAFAIVAIVALLLAAVMLAVPQARAQLAGLWRIGVINIISGTPPALEPAAQIPVTATPIGTPPAAATGAFVPPDLRSLSGLTTLERAEERSGFRILQPSHPVDIGPPDLVFQQDELEMVILVWLDPADESQVVLSLYEFSSSNPVANKFEPRILEETTVGGSPALWVEGPYPLQVTQGEFEWRRIVEGRSLLWESGGITFRLESLLSLEESRLIAESLQ